MFLFTFFLLYYCTFYRTRVSSLLHVSSSHPFCSVGQTERPDNTHVRQKTFSQSKTYYSTRQLLTEHSDNESPHSPLKKNTKIFSGFALQQLQSQLSAQPMSVCRWGEEKKTKNKQQSVVPSLYSSSLLTSPVLPADESGPRRQCGGGDNTLQQGSVLRGAGFGHQQAPGRFGLRSGQCQVFG